MSNHVVNKAAVLIVEDDASMRDFITLALGQRLSLQIISAGDGIEALALFHDHHPQVIVLDILLPQMNGLQFLQQLKDQSALDQTTVIVVSALGYEEVIQQAMEAGASHFIVKPFDIEVLVHRTQQALGESG